MKTHLAITNDNVATIRLEPSSAPMIARSTSASDTQDAYIQDNDAGQETLTLTGQVEVESAESFATLLRISMSAAVGAISFFRQGTKGSGYITINTLPANNDTFIVGPVGHERTYTCKNTLTGAANEVALGADKFEFARNLANAINDDTGEGTRYGTGTAINAHLSAYADGSFSDTTLDGTTQVTIYLRDKLACNRYLGWTLTYSGTGSNVAMLSITGGVNGDLICEIAPGQLGAGALLVLEGGEDVNMPDGYLPTFDNIQVFGRSARLFVSKDSGTGEVEFDVYGGPDAEHLTIVQDSITTSGATMVQSDLITGCEFIKVVTTSNSATAGAAVYAALVY